MRPGEGCALDANHVHVPDRAISVRQNESLGHIVSPKTHAGYRDFVISAQLADHMKMFIGDRNEACCSYPSLVAHGVNRKSSKRS
ncbi:MAG TPA: hypothetical protein VFF50_04485 [Candidatus Deferrimicrobiaceae bacterium]|nr:hypothetical protein [Candidatus Deferrimicrobiaceae bacterium]